MAQMKAFTIPMKNWTLICGKEYLCRKVLKKWMCKVHLCSLVMIQNESMGLGQFLNDAVLIKDAMGIRVNYKAAMRCPKSRFDGILMN